ncbi:hypothetical protein MPSEU_001011100 [Mayamaea pseudoterrestris]|nr:hypothetical protein MPSEU_001011100 [Mayamaea pseudoterrestris]
MDKSNHETIPACSQRVEAAAASDAVEEHEADNPQPRPLASTRLKRLDFCRTKLFVRIFSAKYGPCEVIAGGSFKESLTLTRDVTPFIKTLLLQKQALEGGKEDCIDGDQHMNKRNRLDASDSRHIFSLDAIASSGMRRREIVLLHDTGMNAIFGDPCPGISKRLHIQYILSESRLVAANESGSNKLQIASFAEHERVVLVRRDELGRAFDLNDEFNRMSKLETSMDSENATKDQPEPHVHQATEAVVGSHRVNSLSRISQAAIFETFLPILLPYLEIRERAQSQLVCKLWRKILRQWGVATSIDSTDPTLTRPILRGILSNSFASLQCLFLSDFIALEKQDLSLAIPHLKKLRYLDVSRCCLLDDGTLALLSHLSETLEVLYIKGLKRVTDVGLTALARSCYRLRTLDISCIHQITDASAMQIGQHLPNLRALYLRDNYMLTNESIDVITSNCKELEQLTLWGCICMKHLTFRRDLMYVSAIENLQTLNFWGCHGLTDEAAQAIAGMANLKTLIAAECHRFTDAFVTEVSAHVPQLNHLNLRYCRLISDNAVNVVAERMSHLHSLDVSFCPRLTASSISNLISLRGGTLAELSLRQCRNICESLYGTRASQHRHELTALMDQQSGQSSNMVSHALITLGPRCNLSVFDVRYEGGQANDALNSDSLVKTLTSLGFVEATRGYFHRQTMWNYA